jgi:hypothetical protein
MSAKITVIVYILICFEVGFLLLVLPWTPSFWDENFFMYFVSGKLNASWLPGFLTSGYVRGAVTGLGALNILAGCWDLFKFRESVNRLTVSNEPAPENPVQERNAFESAAAQPAVAVPDHQSPRIPPQ